MVRRVLVLAAMTLVTAVLAPPTFAAEKVVDVRMHTFVVTTAPFPDTLCGSTSTFQSTWSFGNSSVVAWDNGHFALAFDFRDAITDTVTGEVVARANVTHGEMEGVGSLPLNVRHHVTARCTPESGMPGHSITISFGLTINEQGEMTHFHDIVVVH